MKTDTKKQVLKFMQSVDTRFLNTNNFVADFYKFTNWAFSEDNLRYGVSVESLTRSRRYRIALEKAGYIKLGLSRDDISRDSEEIYKKIFNKEPIWMY